MSARIHETHGTRRATSTNGSERGLVHEIRQRRVAQVASAPLSPAEHRRARVLRSTPARQRDLSELNMRLLKVAIGVTLIGIGLIIAGMVYPYTGASRPLVDPYEARIQELQLERQAFTVHHFVAPARRAFILSTPPSSVAAHVNRVALPPVKPASGHPARPVADLIAPPKSPLVSSVHVAPTRAPNQVAVTSHVAAVNTAALAQARPDAHRTPFGIVIYRAAPRAAVVAATPSAPAADIAPTPAPAQVIQPRPALGTAGRAARVASLHGMQVIGFPSATLVLIASKVGGQTLVSPYQVGQSLPGGAQITSIDAQGGRVVTTAGVLASTQ